MVGLPFNRWHTGRFGLGMLVVALLPAWADAAWLGFKNDTNAVIIIQTSTVVNGQVRGGKPHKLYPGEVAWDPVAAPGIRLIGVYDPKQNNKLLVQDTVNSQNADIFLSLQVVVPLAVKGQPPPQPALKLLAAKAPALPPGVVPPQIPGKGLQPPTPSPPGKSPPTPPGKTPSPTNPPATPPGATPPVPPKG